MIKKSIFLLPALCLPLLLSPAAHAGKFYKWVDDNGVTHYGEMPPNTETASIVNVKTGASSDQGKAVDELEARRKEMQAASEPKPTTQAELDEKNKKTMQNNCKIQRQNLAQLNNGGRIKYTDEKGESGYLTDEEIAARKTEVQGYLDSNCKDM